ncbi:hypothetical protein M0R45_026546 [Rubus argutus]|uniref:Uncharacterized protein n=1 Tax=Rubus argutus TaxID=59490 RepID=A0AAW1WXX4_RUBAR
MLLQAAAVPVTVLQLPQPAPSISRRSCLRRAVDRLKPTRSSLTRDRFIPLPKPPAHQQHPHLQSCRFLKPRRNPCRARAPCHSSAASLWSSSHRSRRCSHPDDAAHLHLQARAQPRRPPSPSLMP